MNSIIFLILAAFGQINEYGNTCTLNRPIADLAYVVGKKTPLLSEPECAQEKCIMVVLDKLDVVRVDNPAGFIQARHRNGYVLVMQPDLHLSGWVNAKHLVAIMQMCPQRSFDELIMETAATLKNMFYYVHYRGAPITFRIEQESAYFTQLLNVYYHRFGVEDHGEILRKVGLMFRWDRWFKKEDLKKCPLGIAVKP